MPSAATPSSENFCGKYRATANTFAAFSITPTAADSRTGSFFRACSNPSAPEAFTSNKVAESASRTIFTEVMTAFSGMTSRTFERYFKKSVETACASSFDIPYIALPEPVLAYISGSPASSYSAPIRMDSLVPSSRVMVMRRESALIPYLEVSTAESETNLRARTFESLLRMSPTTAKSASAEIRLPSDTPETSQCPPASLCSETDCPPFAISSAVARAASKRKKDLSRKVVCRLSRLLSKTASIVKTVGLSSSRAYTCEPLLVLAPICRT